MRFVRDLDRLQSGVIEKDNKRITVRTPVTGEIGPVIRGAGVALPLNIAEAPRPDIAQAPLATRDAKDRRRGHNCL